MPTAKSASKQTVALLFAQFAAYHIDRCEAVARRLGDRAEVLAVEVATTSALYAWEPSGGVAAARKITLFPGQSYDDVSWMRRFKAQFVALRRCDWVFVGIGYDRPDIVLLSWALRLAGVRVVVMTESKFDDFPRSALAEARKSVFLSAYRAAIVGAKRQMAYMRYLGFARRPVLPGYDTVSVERVRAASGTAVAPEGTPFDQRNFVFIGRFVPKKNLVGLVEGFAAYARNEHAPRRLVLVGSGAEEAAVRMRAEALSVSHLVDFTGFLSADAVARCLGDALALVLPSAEEQWGLVVNEALALGLPVIVSPAVGSGDVLVRNLVNGFVIEHGSAEGLGQAMATLAGDEALWRRMVAASHDRAWLGDTERLADAVETLMFAESPQAAENLEKFAAVMACPIVAARGRTRDL